MKIKLCVAKDLVKEEVISLMIKNLMKDNTWIESVDEMQQFDLDKIHDKSLKSLSKSSVFLKSLKENIIERRTFANSMYFNRDFNKYLNEDKMISDMLKYNLVMTYEDKKELMIVVECPTIEDFKKLYRNEVESFIEAQYE